MLKDKKIIRNYSYSLLYQVLATIIPLITTPYVSRVLGADGVGTYSYILSICTYFSLFCTLGSSLYGQRKIAYVRDDKEKRTEVFWNICFFRWVLGSGGIIVYYLMFIVDNGMHQIYEVMLFYLASNIFDISWFFHGMEEFRITVTKNILIKTLGTILVFCLVRDKSHVWLYAACISVTTLVANLSLWLCIHKYILRIKVSLKKIFAMIIPILSLFIPQMAIEIYTVIDKTMIGALTGNMAEVGYYEQAQKIIKLSTMFVASLGGVMLPNISHEYARGANEKIQEKIEDSMKFTLISTIAIASGIVGISSNFVNWFYGKGFEEVSILLRLMSVLVVVLGTSNVLGIQFLVPTGRQKEYTFSVCAGCLVNIVLNILLIPKMKAVGATLASIGAEMTVTFLQAVAVRKFLQFNIIFKVGLKTLPVAMMMYGGIRVIEKISSIKGVKLTILQILFGVMIYLIGFLFLNRKK